MVGKTNGSSSVLSPACRIPQSPLRLLGFPHRSNPPYMVSSQLQLHRYATGRESRVITALTLLKSHLFSYQGYVSAALVLGGVDFTGLHLHYIPSRFN
ncbi:proteasome subunit beta type-7-A-like [Magnolia sinica]|uniref:proteasome subunit beta type-7-A-like n=1 Tax=Magnolia sinica TaxID=86752 RepID=UPI002658248E|nr:proteasome subunit beta type-7-A-like [Magnolia sinica]